MNALHFTVSTFGSPAFTTKGNCIYSKPFCR